ncbi:anti-sigma factor family protein [Thalassoroseus pseudoceratinae]|uniref:anti-sigma factor family protein n=1 Tax=Thalassoroseus pseudoceratinae TaxID=2713176 RepID=UPI00141DD8FA|nr:hypothetical protein [Thalassoroseus pseudoceratinae]
MNSSEPLNEDRYEQFVAYLDGELDEASSRSVESTLANDEHARNEVAALARTWDLLDELPRVDVSSDFTEKTLSSVRLDTIVEKEDADSERPNGQKWLISAMLVVGMVSCFLAGLFLVQGISDPKTDVMLQNLPVIENLETYEDIGDAEFLRRLQEMKDFQDAVETQPE